MVVAHLDELRDARGPGLGLLRVVDPVQDRVAMAPSRVSKNALARGSPANAAAKSSGTVELFWPA
jgi:hypothetical protein